MTAARIPRALIITADDFGLHERVNLAVERAHLQGVLTAASLMVGGPAAGDAVARARALSRLRVGLHLVLADGAALLPPADIPALVDARGRFGDRMAADAVRYFLSPGARRQLEREIRAQFDAFARTGLALDHVNTHKHFHLHPTLLDIILRVGREYGMRAMRLPVEAATPVWLRPWTARVRRRLRQTGVACNDYVVGIAHSGAMDEAAFLDAISALPPGVGEIYCHPAVAGDGPITPAMRGYRHADELAALLSPRVAASLDAAQVARGGFSDICAGGAPAP